MKIHKYLIFLISIIFNFFPLSANPTKNINNKNVQNPKIKRHNPKKCLKINPILYSNIYLPPKKKPHFQVKNKSKKVDIKITDVNGKVLLNINKEIKERHLETELNKIARDIVNVGMADIVYADTNYKQRKDKLKELPIIYALDNGYIYPTMVSMTSILETAKKDTKLVFYFLVPGDFTKFSMSRFESIAKKYKKKCRIQFFNMGKSFQGLTINLNLPPSTYYRIVIPSLIKNYDQALYLDGDTLVYEDLTELLNIDMKSYLLLGYPSIKYKELDSHIVTDYYINAGVVLLNLRLLRDEGVQDKLISFISKNKNTLRYNDQTALNAVCVGRVRYLPAKYGIQAFDFVYSNNRRFRVRYVLGELRKALNKPGIIHFCGPTKKKPWLIYNNTNDIKNPTNQPTQKIKNTTHTKHTKKTYIKNTKNKKTWWNFCFFSGYYDEIYNYYAKGINIANKSNSNMKYIGDYVKENIYSKLFI